MDEHSNGTALVLILHGSPRERSSDPARVVAQSPELTNRFQHVMLAFMECNQPTILEAISLCAAMGMRKIVAVPYMLHTGRHLVLDVPGLLLEAAAAYPDVEILMGSPIGTMPQITECLTIRAEEALYITKISD